MSSSIVAIRRRVLLSTMCLLRGAVRIKAGRCGFFGNLFMTLNGLLLCEKSGVIGVPYWGDECLYYDFDRKGNAWEYYFKQSEVIKSSFDNSVSRLKLSFVPDGGPPPRISSCLLSPRELYHRVIVDYVDLQDCLKEELAELQKEFVSGGDVIGVHVRLTDASAGQEGRRVATISDYFDAIDFELERRPSGMVFLATDSQDVAVKMSRRYGARLITQECIRSPDNVSIHGHYDSGILGSPVQKGFEVIKDAYLLSKVNVLIRGHSRVTAFSLCLNPDLEFINVLGEIDYKRLPWLGKGLQT